MDENVMGTTAAASDWDGAPTIEIAAHAGTCLSLIHI